MKIKESNDKISLRNLPKIFIAVTLISVVLRCFQMIKFIDPETGFYTGVTALNILLYVLLLAACCFFAVSSFLSRESAKADLHSVKNTLVGISAIVFAVSLFYDVFSSLFSSVNSLDNVSMSVDSVFKAMMISGTIPLFFRSIFAFFSGIYFVILAKGFLKGASKISKHRILALAPIAWAGFRLIHRFVKQISFINVSELLLELAMLALMILFLTALAQVASGVYSDDFRWRMVGVGLPASLIALTLNSSRLILTFVNSGAFINGEYPFNVTDFVFALFVFIFVSELCKNAGKTQDSDALNEN